MSTKTSIKRIALVAVSALGFGLLSVVPASAQVSTYTATLGTITPADGSVVVGTAVTIPLNITINAVTESAAGTATFTATFTEKPINSALAANGLAANVTGSGYATASATTAVASAATNVITMTNPASDVTAVGPLLAGNFVFTPDTPGRYELAITKGNAADTATAVDQITILVRGAALTQAASGKGATTGTAVVGGSAVAIYHLPGGVTTGTYNITSSGVGSIVNPLVCASLDETLSNTDTEVRCGATGSGTASTINGTNFADGVKFVSAGTTLGNVDNGGTPVSSSFTVDAVSSVAGTQTITVTGVNQSTGIPTVVATVTINWVSSASNAASASRSSLWLAAGATAATASTDVSTTGVNCSASTAIATACANVVVTVRDANGVALLNAPITASVSGPGVLGAIDTDGNNDTTAKSGRAVSTPAGGLAVNVGSFSIYSDGTTGTATITVSSGTVVLGTETVYFYGTPAKLEVTQNLKVARASAAGAKLGCDTASCAYGGVAATTPAVYIVAKDAAGNTVPGLLIGFVSSNPSVIVSSTITEDSDVTDGNGDYNASVTSATNGTSGASATVTFRHQLSTGAFITSDPVTFTLGGSLASMTLSLDKASYQVGEAMVVTRTAKDSDGNPVYDGVASPAVVFSKAIGGTAPAAGEFRSGVSASSSSRPTVFAPSTGGAFEARATYAVAATGALVQVTAKGSVSDDASTAAANAASDAAAEAIDAANAATDAANLAAEAADAATVAAEEARDAADAATAAVEKLASDVATLMAALKAQITTLANTVAKIAKKVKA